MEKNTAVDNVFNQKNIHKLTVNALETAFHNLKEDVYSRLMDDISYAATKKLSFTCDFDLTKEVDDIRSRVSQPLPENSHNKIESAIVDQLRTVDFEVEVIKKDGNTVLKISW